MLINVVANLMVLGIGGEGDKCKFRVWESE